MRTLIARNWKMHGMAPQLGEIEEVAAPEKANSPSANIPIRLPATLIAGTLQKAAGRMALGAEDCSAEISGAFTGHLGAEILRGTVARAVIVGHSERRLHHGETDAVAEAKAKSSAARGAAGVARDLRRLRTRI
jgi:triosephosphate isomerase